MIFLYIYLYTYIDIYDICMKYILYLIILFIYTYKVIWMRRLVGIRYSYLESYDRFFSQQLSNNSAGIGIRKNWYKLNLKLISQCIYLRRVLTLHLYNKHIYYIYMYISKWYLSYIITYNAFDMQYTHT